MGTAKIFLHESCPTLSITCWSMASYVSQVQTLAHPAKTHLGGHSYMFDTPS